jgi:hypothetical protein
VQLYELPNISNAEDTNWNTSQGLEGQSLLAIWQQSICCETPTRVPTAEKLVRDEFMVCFM